MFYSDRLTRGFLESGTYIPWMTNTTNPTQWQAYDDPTYLSFSIRFVTIPMDFGVDGVGEDYMPMGLLLEDKVLEGKGEIMPYADSTQAYFRRRGEYYRAKMIKEFVEGIESIQKESPWVFQSIKGLGDLWKVDPTKAWRTKDKFITITCSESISLRISYLIDLYRKAMWDSAYHRWTTPDLQRYFGLEVIISEVRTMQSYKGEGRKPAEEEGGLMAALQGIPAANALLTSQVGQAVSGIVDFFKEKESTARPSVWNTGTYMRFYLDMCELDPFSISPAFLDASSFSDGKPVEMELKIKVGRAREFNVYGLLGAILTDTYSEYSRSKLQAEAYFRNYSEASVGKSKVGVYQNDLFARKGLDQNLDFYAKDTTRNENQDKRKLSLIGLKNDYSLPVGGGSPTTGTPPNPLIPRSFVGSLPGPLQGIVNGVIAQGAALAGKLADSALGAIGLGKQDRLGNVYDLNPGSVANVLGVLTDPAAAAQNFLSAQAANLSDKIGAKKIGTAELGGVPGVGEVATALSSISATSLIDEDGVIGIATFLTDAATNEPELTDKFLGAVELLAQQVAGTPLENQSISFIINSLASENLQGDAESAVLEGAPTNTEGGGRVDLQAPSILNTTLGKILLEGGDSSQIQGTAGKVVLSAAYAAPQDPELGKEPLTGKRVKKTMSDESVSLVAPGKNEIDGGNVGLEGPDAAIDSGVSPTTVPLESPTTQSPKLGNVGLDGDPSPPSKNPGKVDLK